MQLVIFEDAGFVNLLPLVYARATFDLRCGFDDLASKSETALGLVAESLFVRESIAAVIAERQTRRINQPATADMQFWVNGRLLLRRRIDPPKNSAAWLGDTLLCARLPRAVACKLGANVLLDPAKLRSALADVKPWTLPASAARLIDYPWQLIHANEAEITRQFGLGGDRDHKQGTVHEGAHLLNASSIRIGAGSVIKPTAVLDAEEGPITLGENVRIGPHAVIVGPCHISDNCLIKPHARLAGSSIGPSCKVGGEVEATIFQGLSNKQHDGFFGHSYVGKWVNLGADTVTSDLKNTYGPISVPVNGRPIDSGEMFVGTVFGDHAKTGIHTALPTGCVIGFASNVFVGGYSPKFVPSFSWLTDEGRQTNDPQRALAVAHKAAARRNRKFSPAEDALFLSIAEEAKRVEAGA